MVEANPFFPLPDPYRLVRDIVKRTTGAAFGGIVKPIGEQLVEEGMNAMEGHARAMMTGAGGPQMTGQHQYKPIGIQGYYDRHLGQIDPSETTAGATHTVTPEEADNLLQYMRHFRFLPDRGSDYLQEPGTTITRGAGDCEDMTLLVSEILMTNGIRHRRLFGYLVHQNGEWEGHSWVDLMNGTIWDWNRILYPGSSYIISGIW